MRSHWKILCLAGLLVAGTNGCQPERAQTDSAAWTPPAELGATIGSLADVARPEPVAVEGYGLVGGLAGAGSGYCPPEVRAYLKQYILTQLPNERVDVDGLLNSKDTAVVVLEARIPATPSLGESFDVRASLLAGSEATSLAGGWLYKADLVATGTFGAQTRPLATVEGPVFINQIGTAQIERRSGYVLGGGRTLYQYTALLTLRKPDHRVAGLIRNRLSERYGPGVAQALSPGAIEVRIPADYRRRKGRFIAMIPATFLEVTDELTNARISSCVHELAVPGDQDSREGTGTPAAKWDPKRDESRLGTQSRGWDPTPNAEFRVGDPEIFLEAIGRESVTMLAGLLKAPQAQVRLRAGRCMLGLGDNRALAPLRDLALDPASPCRLEAIDAVMAAARPEDAASLGRRLLRDGDLRVVLAAYEYLRDRDDPAVTREVIGRSFLLEQIVQTSHKAIFVARSGSPRVVLFGAPLRCRDNLFVESPDQAVILDSRSGQGFVSVIRKHPSRPGVIGPVRTTPDLGDLVRTLGNEPAAGPGGQLRSLGVPYTQVITLLEQLSVKGAVAAEFWPGPLPRVAWASSP
jgi:hypothetical protein